jgi:predicted NBD/HSP70 family sugar kinase
MQITYNTSNVKQMNTELIRVAIRSMPGNTKAGIAAVTGLSHATCNNLLNELVAIGEVLELDKENKGGGRPSQRYQYNFDFFNALSLYIDNDCKKTVLRYAVFNLAGEILEEASLYKEHLDYQTIEDLVTLVLQKHPGIKTIGIGIPGVVAKQRLVNTCDVEALNNFPLADRLENHFKINTTLMNDMNATAIGYYQEQDYQEETSIAVMTFIKDNCPGSGIIADGHILHGYTNFAGEIANLPYGLTHEQMEEMMGKCSTAFPIIVKSICSMIAIVNPETIILTGTLLSENRMAEIQKNCGELIPEEHMPQLIYRESIHDFYLKGLLAMSLRNLSNPIMAAGKKI